LFYEDGSHDVLCTGPDWTVRASATALANIHASEDHDRRLYPVGWDAPGFGAEDWQPAKSFDRTSRQASISESTTCDSSRDSAADKYKETSAGTVCFDMGQNCSTMVKIVVEGRAGSVVIVRYGESVREDGTTLMPDPLFKEFKTGVYSRFILADTGGPETWQPDFCFTAARYIQLDGVTLDAASNDLPVVHSVVN